MRRERIGSPRAAPAGRNTGRVATTNWVVQRTPRRGAAHGGAATPIRRERIGSHACARRVRLMDEPQQPTGTADDCSMHNRHSRHPCRSEENCSCILFTPYVHVGRIHGVPDIKYLHHSPSTKPMNMRLPWLRESKFGHVASQRDLPGRRPSAARAEVPGPTPSMAGLVLLSLPV